LHLVSVADGSASGVISAEATRLAIDWCDYLKTHARRIYHMATDVMQQAAKALSRRMRKKEIEDSFIIRSLYRKGWQGLDDQELAEAACDELAHHIPPRLRYAPSDFPIRRRKAQHSASDRKHICISFRSHPHQQRGIAGLC
jgi:hypothetical protein